MAAQSTHLAIVPFAMAVKEKSRSEKKISKPKKFKPGVADTARNLFGREWITKNVDGTVDDFNMALAAITPTAAFQKYKIDKARLKLEKKSAMVGGSRFGSRSSKESWRRGYRRRRGVLGVLVTTCILLLDVVRCNWTGLENQQ